MPMLYHAAIAITQGLLDCLPDDEVEAVLNAGTKNLPPSDNSRGKNDCSGYC
jgi:hypothetical protein